MEKLLSLLMFFVLSLSFAVFANDIGGQVGQSLEGAQGTKQSIDELRRFKDHNKTALESLSPQARAFLKEHKSFKDSAIKDPELRKEIRRYLHNKKQAFNQLSPKSKMLLTQHQKRKKAKKWKQEAETKAARESGAKNSIVED